MEATAVSVGKAVLDGALSYASSKAAKEIVLQLGVNRDVEFITEELQMMQSFLMTADEEQSQNKVLTTWVKQIRDLAYKVEDSLMDLGLCLEMKPSWGCIPFSPCDRRRIAMEVKELRAKVEEVSSRNLRYRLIKESSNAKPVALEEQARIVSASMFGINANFEQEKPKVDLHQLIHSNDVDLRVISVWGSSGDLGKTSAIQEAYDDPRVIKKFGFCAWIRLMHPFNAQEFLQSLVRQFYESSHDEVEKQGNERSVGANVLAKMEKMDQSDLVREFDANLCSNSYLIVINDLSTIEEWHCIKKYFPDNKKQSRIIVSTQQVEIASLCAEKPYQASELKQLSCDQTIYLFHKKNLEEQVTMPSANATMLETSEATRAAMEKEKMKAMHASCSAKSISSSNKVTSTEENTAMPSSEIQEDQQPKSADEDKICNSTARNKFDRSRTLVLVDELLTGRETEKSIVIKLVCQPENNQGCNVISVWGMGGLGKTTLVRSVYRSQELSSLKRAWSTAMRPFNPEVLLRDLALQLQKSIQEDPAGATAAGAQTKSITVMKLKELKEELSRLLNIQKCLIVLDDISSASEWELVKSSLYNAGRIIVTTREKNIAEYCSGGYRNMYNLEGLKDDDALDLFKKKVFKHNIATNVFVPAMMEQARLILKKCDGLPLAISAIGGFLATKPKTAIEWRKMNDHISAELEINPELRTIKTVLMRSYDGLPYHLKSAFLYMSIFWEDRIIRRNRLVRRWMAEGYSREMHGMTAAEVGNNYFDELLDRSMILPGEGVDYFNEKIDACQLHDIIHEICISKAREENLVFTLEEGCRLRSTQDAIRHLVIGSNWRRDKDLLESMLDLSHVRSLTVYGEWESFFISDNMRFLRVLDLEDTLGLRDHHLEKIGQLLHLKYLSLRGCQNIYYLPNSFGNLRQLQTLDVRGTRIFELPTTITKLRKLQHLRTTDDYSKKRDHLMGEHNIIGKYASRVTASSSSVALLVQAAPLFWRPQVLDDDLNRHDILNIYRFLMVCLEEKGTIYGWLEGVEAPRGIGKLKALHTLDLVNVARGKGKATLKELGGLTQLYKLGVAGISNENSKEFWSAIAGHNQLRSLSVQGYPWRELDGCLGEGLSPPSCIKSLKLYGELVRVTEWIHQLQHLSKLILAYTHLEHNAAVQVLGGLPSLAVLRLMWGSFVGEQLHFHGPSFPNLVVLELNGLIGVDSVVFEENTMPKLELLQADWCCSLKEISGLPLLTSLKGVRLGYQISQELKEQVQSQVAEYLKHISLDTNYVSSFSME